MQASSNLETREEQGGGTISSSQVQVRTRKACDGCRTRKVKCFYNGEPECRGCISLNIPCTQDQPRKKRGPANQYLKARNQEFSSYQSPYAPSPSTASTITPNSRAGCSALDQLASSETVKRILDDWFDLIHSVCPIHHHANFLKRLADDDASHDPEFAAVVIAVCAATVSSLPRKAAMEYPQVTVERCFEVITQNGLLDNQRRISLAFCQAKYHLSASLASAQGADAAINFRLLGEAATGVKYLTFYELAEMPPIEQQLTKRLYWLVFCGLCTMDLYSRPSIGILSPQDNIQALQPLPLTDSELDPTNIDPSRPWHGDSMSYIPGLNYLCHLFLLWHSSQQVCPHTPTHLQHSMTLVQRALDTLPPNLRWRGGLSRPPESNFGTEVQTANLYITQLHIRSTLLQQMHTLLETPNSAPQGVQGLGDITKQRAMIVKDLLEILYHMSEEILEANGQSLVPKARDIGSALLDEMGMGASPLGGSESFDLDSQKASVDLRKLLEKLERLDYLPQNSSGLS